MSKDELNQQVPEGQPLAGQQSQPQPPQPQSVPSSVNPVQGNPAPVFPQAGGQQGVPSQAGQEAPVFPTNPGQAQQAPVVPAGQPGFAQPTPPTMPGQVASPVPASANPRKTKRIIWSVIGGVGAIIIVILGILLYRFLSGNVAGTYKVNNLSNSLTKDLKKTELSDSSVAYSDFTEGAQVQLDIKDETVTATVSYSVVYDDFYAAMKSDYTSTFSSEKSNFTDDEWNYLVNTLITSDYSEKDFEQELDKEVTEKGLEYDSSSGMVTGTVFEGKLNRVNGKIEITDVNQDVDLGNFDEGQKLSYKKTSEGLTLTDDDGDEMTAKKN